MKFSSRKRVLLFFLTLAFASFSQPSFSQETQPLGSTSDALNSEMSKFIQSLLSVARQANKTTDLRPLQTLIGDQLEEWYRPGICISHAKTFKSTDLRGWYPESGGTQDPVLLLTMAFNDIKKAPLTILKNKHFERYKPDSCETADKWQGRWIVYPGDYLSEKEPVCPDYKGKAAQLRAEKTLLYFTGGDNYYFGLRFKNGHWVLHSFIADDDCDA